MPSGERWPHGTRARYVGAKCRCEKCRKANRLYYHQRKALSDAAARELSPTAAKAGPCPGVNGKPCPIGSRVRKDSPGGRCEKCRGELIADRLVLAGPATEHVRALGRAGVGYKSVADAAGVARSTLAEVLRGERLQVRSSTLRRILGVTPAAIADHAVVPARPTWRLVRKLLAAGLPKVRIAEAIGNKRALQLGRRRVLARTAHAIEKFARRELKVLDLMAHVCPLCGYTHADDRQAAEWCAARLAGLPELPE
jgi:hypothetical protein